MQARALPCRDTAGDVGTTITTPNEAERESAASVITAAGKRLGEALRSVEEYLKIEDALAARAIEQLRYRSYTLEALILSTLTPGRERMAGATLHVLITESLCRRPWLEAADMALQGGAGCLQLREKTTDGGELLRRAEALSDLCHRHGAICVINDRPDVALLSGADGVHVGQGDLPAAAARRLLGPDKIIGVSTANLGQARRAVLDGADYVGCGPTFVSTTKPKDPSAVTAAGVAYAAEATRHLPIPAVAISGITAANAVVLRDVGVRHVAVSSAVLGADDPRAAAAALVKALSPV